MVCCDLDDLAATRGSGWRAISIRMRRPTGGQCRAMICRRESSNHRTFFPLLFWVVFKQCGLCMYLLAWMGECLEILSRLKISFHNNFVCLWVSPFFLLLSFWLNESRQFPQSALSPLLKPRRTLKSVINTVPLHLLYPLGHGPCCGSQALLASLLLSDPEELVSLRVGDLRKHSFAPLSMGRWSGVQDLIKLSLIGRKSPLFGSEV